MPERLPMFPPPGQLQIGRLPIIAEHPHLPTVLRFDQAEHRYFACGTGEDGCTDACELLSVTTFVKRHFPQFDARAVATRAAARDGSSPESLLALWEEKRAAAAELGTRVHEVAEDAFHERPPRHIPRHERERALFAAAWQAVADLRAAGWTILAAETPVYSERLGLAGTIDLSARDPDGRLHVLDWKTNETLDSAPKFGNEHGAGPCAELPHCNLYHYALQLDLYAIILRTESYTDEWARPKILHVTPAGVIPVDPPPVRTASLGMLLAYRLDPQHLPF